MPSEPRGRASAPDADQKPRNRGLPSIQEARDARAEGKTRFPSTKFWGYAALILAVTFILHWKWTSSEVDRGKQKVLADQRGVAAELGPRWIPLRDKIEKWTIDLAKSAGPEVVDRDALTKWDFRSRAGLYLRLRVEDAQTPEAIRTGAKGSLRDAFTTCLMRVPNPNATAGKECKRNRDCAAREMCNEQDHCAKPAQPFNLRVAYRSMRILSDEWVRDVQAVDGDLQLRLFQTSFDDAIRDELPLAAEVLGQAQYYLVVLDETPPDLALPAADAGTTVTDAVLGSPHFARVGVYRLSDDKPLLRIRRSGGGDLIGGTANVEANVLAARARQANSCALALSVREAMGDTDAAAVPPQ